MKTTLIIAAFIGTVLGITVRKTSIPPPSSPESTIAPQSRTPPSPESSPNLPPHIHGKLTLTEIQNLPLGAHRSAETSLWAFSATSKEFANHWDTLLASGVKDHLTLDLALSAWTRRFPEQALAHLKETPSELRFWRILGRLDPEKGLALIDRSNPVHFSNLLTGIADQDPELAKSLLDEHPGGYQYGPKVALFEKHFEEDPAAALTAAAKNDLYQWNHLREWAAQDPQKALSWALENQELNYHKHRNAEVLPDLVAIVMAEDPRMTAATITALPTGAMKTTLLKAQVKHLAANNPAEARKLADSHQGSTRHHLLHEFAQCQIRSNPAAALEILTTFAREDVSNLGNLEIIFPNGNHTQGGIDMLRQDTVITAWHQNSPQEAAAYFNSNKATPEQKTIYQNLIDKP